MTFDRSLAWLTLFSLLPLTLRPSPAWPDWFPPEPASYRLPEKPIEATSQENAFKENSSSGPDFRFASSDFTQDRNRILWQNVATQELAHRFGSFLTSAAGNPFGMLGRALAHWGVFFDSDFSPMDGNDWVDNGDANWKRGQGFTFDIITSFP